MPERTAEVFTRQQYLTADGDRDEQFRAHRRFHAQLVTERTRRQVRDFFGIETLLRARGDRHLNSIPVRRWDALCFTDPKAASGPFRALIDYGRDALAATGDRMTRAGLVCVAKEAARQLIETEHERQEDAGTKAQREGPRSH